MLPFMANGSFFPQHHTRANASIVRELRQQAAISVQLDVRFEIAPGRTIIESFSGVGETREKAVSDAFDNFALNSFHVLLAAFLDPNDDHVSEEEWIIGGEKRRVTLGNIGVRGKPPVSGEQLGGWFEPFEQKIKEKSLGPETYWMRLYYGQRQGKTMACEVLLDNTVWEEMQTAIAALDWPPGEEFYSVRLFLVIHGQNGDALTPVNTTSLHGQSTPKTQASDAKARLPWWRFRRR
ncbi:MAG TPA: DUF6348 family protein [Chthonomonadaceae bacterium]|nr:DUF6348 family protein [Chthonomonadaceae bacterium]